MLALLSKGGDDLNAADRALASFIASNKLTPVGKGSTAALVARLDAARTNLQSSIDAAKLLAARQQSTAADAARFRAANLTSLTEATAATQAATAALAQPSYVDHSEEDRAAAARRAADAAATRQAAAEAAAASRQAATQAAAAAQQTADQQRKSDEERRRASADAKLRDDVDNRSGVVFQALKDQSDLAKQISAVIDALLIKNNLTSEARNTGMRMQRRTDANRQGRITAQMRMSALKDKSAAQAASALPAITADVNQLGRELSALQDEEKALISSPKTFIGGIVSPISAAPQPADSPAPAARRIEDIVPVCDFTFEPADGKPMQLGIDGGPLRPLPTHARLASGRHTLNVRRNADAAERHELLLCGYVSTVPIEPLR